MHLVASSKKQLRQKLHRHHLQMWQLLMHLEVCMEAGVLVSHNHSKKLLAVSLSNKSSPRMIYKDWESRWACQDLPKLEPTLPLKEWWILSSRPSSHFSSKMDCHRWQIAQCRQEDYSPKQVAFFPKQEPNLWWCNRIRISGSKMQVARRRCTVNMAVTIISCRHLEGQISLRPNRQLTLPNKPKHSNRWLPKLSKEI